MRWVTALDEGLLAVPRSLQLAAIAATLCVMLAVSLPNVPAAYVDYSGIPLLEHIDQPETYGTDSIADMYEAKVVLNDVADMYTKEKLAQTPLEAATWSKEASSPYPPAVLLAEAALYAVGEWSGVRFYGMILMLACVFIGLSAYYFLETRWYLFPLVYLNFFYFGERFVYVQDGSYLVMLVVIMAALLLARRRHEAAHLLTALAMTMKLSPLYYVKNVFRMRKPVAFAFVGVLVAGLVLPVFVWENYLYIYSFNYGVKGDWDNMLGALALVLPFSVTLWYVETRLDFDMEDRLGWGLVPFAMFMAFKMNVARHLLIVLLVPDKRGIRNAALAFGMLFHLLVPGIVRLNSVLPIATVFLALALVYFLDRIGWDVVREDLCEPTRTVRLMLRGSDARATRTPPDWRGTTG